VIFSLALPVYLILVRKFPIPATVLAIMAALVGWAINDPVTSYLPMFFFGALLAQYWSLVERAFRFVGGRGWVSNLSGVGLVIFAICATTSFFLLGPWITSLGLPARVVTLPIILIGILLIVVIGVRSPRC
jgi:hypothetical protein